VLILVEIFIKTGPSKMGKQVRAQPRVNKSSSKLFLIFPGIQNVIGKMDTFEFLRNSGIGNENYIFFKIEGDRFLFNGISEEVNNFDKLIVWIKDFIKINSHIKESFTIGASSGTFPALIIAHQLRFSKAFLFAAVLSRTKFTGQLLDKNRNNETIKLRDFLNKPNNRTEYHFYFNLLKDRFPYFMVDPFIAYSYCFCSGVVLHPLPFWNHGTTIINLLKRDELKKVFTLD
jgi:hypothetical protein